MQSPSRNMEIIILIATDKFIRNLNNMIELLNHRQHIALSYILNYIVILDFQCSSSLKLFVLLDERRF